MNARKSILTAVLLSLVAFPVAALAGTATGGATFPEQIVQEVTAVQTKVTEAQQLVQEIQQYENMVQNMVTLPQSMMSQIMQPVSQLYNLAQQAQQLGYAGQNISSQFQNMNSTFNPQISDQYSQQYGSITSNLNGAINNALQAANLNPSNFLTQQQAMQQVSSAMQNPQSRNAILQAGVAVGQAEVSDLTQLNQTASAQASLQAAWIKKKQMKDESNRQMANNVINNMYSGGPITSNAPSLAAYSLNGYHP